MSEIKLNRKELLEILSIVKPAIDDSISTEMACFRFDGGTVSGHNDNLHISTKFDSKLKCIIPAKVFINLVSSFGSEFITLKIDKNKLLIKSGRSDVKLSLFDFDKYPDISVDEKSKNDKVLEITDDLILGLKSLLKYISSDTSTEYYQYLFIKGKYIYSTDGLRIARYKLKKSYDELLLSKKLCDELVKYGGGKLHYNKKRIFVKYDMQEILSISQELTFPDCESIFKKFENKLGNKLVKISKSLKDTFTRIGYITSDLSDSVCKMTLNDKSMSIESDNKNIGKIVERYKSDVKYKDSSLFVDVNAMNESISSIDSLEFIDNVIHLAGENLDVLVSTIESK